MENNLRLYYNLAILRQLQEAAISNPDLRFCQLLSILGINEFVDVNGQQYIKDNFYVESRETLKRLTNCKIFEKTSDTQEKVFNKFFHLPVWSISKNGLYLYH